MTTKQKNLIVRTVTGVFFVAIMVTGLLRPVAMVTLFSLITAATMWEYTGLVNVCVPDVQVNRFISSAAAVCLFLAMAAYGSGVAGAEVFIPYLLTIVYLFISELYTGNANALADWAYTMLGQMYIALPFSTLNLLAFQQGEYGVEFTTLVPLSVFVFLWANDTGAYCSGSLFGRHKLFPRISPGKTWEGSVGGGLLVVILASCVGWHEAGDGADLVASILQWAGMGVVVVFFGTWGDLVESLIKRTIGIKDSGNILPGHGGMLDRFDSSLMAIPACVIYLFALQYLG